MVIYTLYRVPNNLGILGSNREKGTKKKKRSGPKVTPGVNELCKQPDLLTTCKMTQPWTKTLAESHCPKFNTCM